MDPQTPAEYYSLDEILAAPDLQSRDVPVPEWGGKAVRIRVLTHAERQTVVRDATVGTPEGGRRLDDDLVMRYVIAAALEAPALTRPQVDALWARSASSVDRIGRAILRLNGMGPDAEATAAAAF